MNDHHNAVAVLRDLAPTWGQLRDHMMNRTFDEPDSLPEFSSVNPSIPIGRAWQIYDAAIVGHDPDAVIDLALIGNELLAANIVRDFGFPSDDSPENTLP